MRVTEFKHVLDIIKSSSISSAGSSLKGNLISVRIKFIDQDGINQIGYCSLVPTEIDEWKLSYHKITKTFRFYGGGSAVRNNVDAWIKSDPQEIADLEVAIKKAAKKAYAEGDVIKRRKQAVIDKCNKALREWSRHAFKHGMTRDEVIAIVDESIVASTMDD